MAPRAEATLVYASNAYAARPGAPDELFAAGDGGAGVTRLTFCNNDVRRCASIEAAPAPDRLRVALRRVDTDTNKDGQLTPADGEALLVVDLSRSVEGGILPSNARVSGVDWSPTGDVLVYAAAGEGGIEDLYRADPNGQNTRNLTSTATVRERRPRIDPSGSAALFVEDPLDAEGLAAAVEEAIARRPELAELGRAEASRFTWQRTAEGVAQALREAAAWARGTS